MINFLVIIQKLPLNVLEEIIKLFKHDHEEFDIFNACFKMHNAPELECNFIILKNFKILNNISIAKSCAINPEQKIARLRQ